MFRLEMTAGALASAISAVSTVIKGGDSVAILRSTYISVEDGSVTFISTNSDQTVKLDSGAVGSGVACVETSLLYMKASALRADQAVVIESADGKFATMKQGRTNWKLPLLDHEGFPAHAASAITGDMIHVDGPKFITALKSVAVAVNASADRHYLAGVFCHYQDDELVLAATDGKRFHVVSVTDDIKKFDEFIIPAQAIAHIVKLFGNSGGLEIHTDEFAFSVKDGKTVFKSKKVEGTYPEYWKYIPSTDDALGKVIVDAADFIATLGRACAIDTNDKNIGATAKISMGEDSISITSHNVAGEVGDDVCDAERLDGEDLTLGTSARQLIDAVHSMPAVDSIAIHYISIEKPLILTRWPNERKDYRLIQPVRG